MNSEREKNKTDAGWQQFIYELRFHLLGTIGCDFVSSYICILAFGMYHLIMCKIVLFAPFSFHVVTRAAYMLYVYQWVRGFIEQ